MPPRKTTARYSLYRTFVDAYMKGHSDKPRSVRSLNNDKKFFFSYFFFFEFRFHMPMLKLNGIKSKLMKNMYKKKSMDILNNSMQVVQLV